MEVKTFEAVDMKQALDLVRDELGPGAVIVASRTIRKDGGMFGLLGRRVLEVTAAVEDSGPRGPRSLQGLPSSEIPTSRSARRGIYHDMRAVKQAVDPVLDEVRAIRETLTGLQEQASVDPRDLQSDVSQIRTLLSSMLSSGSVGADEAGAAAQRLLYFLLGRGIDEALARSLVGRVVSRVEPGGLSDLERLKLNVAAEMRNDLLRAERGSPAARVQIFIGPTGVGKTTTIAKLAARARDDSSEKVLIVTTDVHRVAAVDQMVRFGEMIDVPVEVAVSDEDLARVLAESGQYDRIFIDTTGRSHRDPTTTRQLRRLIDAAGESEVMLVMSATTRALDSREILEAYSELPCSRLLLTKLDETRIYGELYNCIVRSGRPLACVTTGQSVPSQLETLDTASVLRKVLHG